MVQARRHEARPGSAAEVANLQAAIRSAGHNSQADPTSVSALSAAERKSRLGLEMTAAELQATARAIQVANFLPQPPACSGRRRPSFAFMPWAAGFCSLRFEYRRAWEQAKATTLLAGRLS